jgi:2'-5' RNA ligase
MARSFSIWLCPQHGAEADALQDAIKTTTRAHGGDVFEPHVTVLGSIPERPGCDLPRLCAVVDELSRCMRVHPTLLTRVATGTLFYQCVYGLVEPSPTLGATFKAACASLPEVTPPTPYMPHVSFLYSDVASSVREAARAALAPQFDGFHFTADRLELWDTTGPVAGWRCVHRALLLPHA